MPVRGDRVDLPRFRLGLVGFGEVGSSFASGFHDVGMGQICAFDPGSNAGAFSDLIQARAASCGVTLVDSLDELASESDVLLGLTPGAKCVEVASRLKFILGNRHIYADLASTTPAVKLEVGRVLDQARSGYVDGAIMSPVRVDRHQTEVLVSGGVAAHRLIELLSPWGMRVDLAGERIGDASAVKILRSVLTKGLDALIFECVVASDRYGISEQVVRSLSGLMDKHDSFSDAINYHLTSAAVHAARRSEEVSMSADALCELGLDPIMSRASAARLDWVASLELGYAFGGVPPADYHVVLDAIRERIAGIGHRSVELEKRGG